MYLLKACLVVYSYHRYKLSLFSCRYCRHSYPSSFEFFLNVDPITFFLAVGYDGIEFPHKRSMVLGNENIDNEKNELRSVNRAIGSVKLLSNEFILIYHILLTTR